MNDPAAAAAAYFDEHGYDVTVYLTARQKRVGGILFSLIAGLLSGSTFTAPEYVVDSVLRYSGPLAGSPFPGANTTLLDHVYSHFTGIFLGLLLLRLLRRVAQPPVDLGPPPPPVLHLRRHVGPGDGLLVRRQRELVHLVISFPMVTLGPGLVNVLRPARCSTRRTRARETTSSSARQPSSSSEPPSSSHSRAGAGGWTTE